MGAKAGLALKALQWFIRGIQFLSCAVVLALFSYFLAVAATHDYDIPTWWKAVEGISGVGVLYTLIGLLLLCCVAGHPFASAIAILLDIAFVGAFIYVAQANRNGANTCRGNVDTLFGTGRDNNDLNADAGLPNFRQLCQMQKAVLAVSIIAIVFFLLSAFVEVVLVRHRRKEQRFGPSPANNYTSGYGANKRGGLFGRFRQRKGSEEQVMNPNVLPEHAHPDQVRPSYATEGTANAGQYNKYGESGFSHDGQTAYPDRTSYPNNDGQLTHGYAR